MAQHFHLADNPTFVEEAGVPLLRRYLDSSRLSPYSFAKPYHGISPAESKESQSSRKTIMRSRTGFHKNLIAIATTTIVMILCGMAFPLLFGRVYPHTIRNGMVVGLVVGIVSSTAELFWFNTVGRRWRFSYLLVTRTVFYLILISVTTIIVVAHHLTMMKALTFAQALQDPEFNMFLYEGEFVRVMVYALAISFIINFIRQVNRLLGQNVLLNYATGKYHQPKSEERIFMFLDLKSSTTIAERLGDTRYHRFLNDFFYDITPAIVESRGQIYQYVGDEVVVTWDVKTGVRDVNCLKCYFGIAATIHRRSERYQQRYGVVPTFKAGYHYGTVMTGEIGDIKKAIVFHGDTINTASRIRSECTVAKKNLLMSGDLLRRMSIDDALTPETIGSIRLRGRRQKIELFTLKEAA